MKEIIANISLSESTTEHKTMSLKEIADLLGVRHNNAMKVVEKMAETPEFGLLLKISKSPSDGIGRPFDTYDLDKRQSIAVSARLNTAMLMRVIDRWQELEIDYVNRLEQQCSELKEKNTKLLSIIPKKEHNCISSVLGVHMPYQAIKTVDGRLLLLNRNYKPLGFFTSDWVNYDDFPIVSICKGIGRTTLVKLSHDSMLQEYKDGSIGVWLYDDRSKPTLNAANMNSYIDKLKLLMKIEISTYR
jgi:phage regulator Rha-like protein